MTAKQRPDFIPAEDFRAYLTVGKLNKLFRVDGMKPASYIYKEERNGTPIKSKGVKGEFGVTRGKPGKRYRPIDIITRAWGRSQSVQPSAVDEMVVNIETLTASYARLRAEYDQLAALIPAQKHEIKVNHVSADLTGRSLLREREIVDASVGFVGNSGVYFLVAGDEVVYVGQSVDVGSRVRQHVGAKEFDRWAYIPCDKRTLDALESLYIHVLRPQYNVSDYMGVIAPLRLDDLLALGNLGKP